MTDKTPGRIAFEAWLERDGGAANFSRWEQAVAWLVWEAATERAPVKSHRRDNAEGYSQMIDDEINAMPPLDAPFKPDWANYRQGVADGRDEALEEAAKVCESAMLVWNYDACFECANAIRALQSGEGKS